METCKSKDVMLTNVARFQYLGEEGDKCELKAAVVLSNPWNLDTGSIALQRTWIGLEVYSKAMCSGLMGLVEK